MFRIRSSDGFLIDIVETEKIMKYSFFNKCLNSGMIESKEKIINMDYEENVIKYALQYSEIQNYDMPVLVSSSFLTKVYNFNDYVGIIEKNIDLKNEIFWGYQVKDFNDVLKFAWEHNFNEKNWIINRNFDALNLQKVAWIDEESLEILFNLFKNINSNLKAKIKLAILIMISCWKRHDMHNFKRIENIVNDLKLELPDEQLKIYFKQKFYSKKKDYHVINY